MLEDKVHDTRTFGKLTFKLVQPHPQYRHFRITVIREVAGEKSLASYDDEQKIRAMWKNVNHELAREVDAWFDYNRLAWDSRIRVNTMLRNELTKVCTACGQAVKGKGMNSEHLDELDIEKKLKHAVAGMRWVLKPDPFDLLAKGYEPRGPSPWGWNKIPMLRMHGPKFKHRNYQVVGKPYADCVTMDEVKLLKDMFDKKSMRNVTALRVEMEEKSEALLPTSHESRWLKNTETVMFDGIELFHSVKSHPSWNNGDPNSGSEKFGREVHIFEAGSCKVFIEEEIMASGNQKFSVFNIHGPGSKGGKPVLEKNGQLDYAIRRAKEILVSEERLRRLKM